MVVTVLKKSVMELWAQEMKYTAVVQTVLLYRSESWVVTGKMLTGLEGFNYWLGRTIAVNGDVRWEWPPVEESM